jgi:hypothetical protein
MSIHIKQGKTPTQAHNPQCFQRLSMHAITETHCLEYCILVYNKLNV